MKNNNLVIGCGQIGSAIATILACDGIDKGSSLTGQYDVIHICFPYSEEFITQVKEYQERYEPKITIIHSTVPMGTSKQLGAVHSPVRGVHPNLEEGIRTFPKFFGGEKSEEAADIFRGKMTCVYGLTSDESEALKLLDTLQYGLNIMIEKEIYKFCEEKGLNPEVVYRKANITYNAGYIKLGRPEVVRPYLKHVAGPIGGHCIIPNAKLIDIDLAKLLIAKNEEYKKDVL